MSNETCKCQDWCDASYHDRKIRILTGHHTTGRGVRPDIPSCGGNRSVGGG